MTNDPFLNISLYHHEIIGKDDLELSIHISKWQDIKKYFTCQDFVPFDEWVIVNRGDFGRAWRKWKDAQEKS